MYLYITNNESDIPNMEEDNDATDDIVEIK